MKRFSLVLATVVLALTTNFISVSADHDGTKSGPLHLKGGFVGGTVNWIPAHTADGTPLDNVAAYRVRGNVSWWAACASTNMEIVHFDFDETLSADVISFRMPAPKDSWVTLVKSFSFSITALDSSYREVVSDGIGGTAEPGPCPVNVPSAGNEAATSNRSLLDFGVLVGGFVALLIGTRLFYPTR
jgi:hypothetical protein